MAKCEDYYWALRSFIEITCGPLSMYGRLKGIEVDEDFAVYVGDVDKVSPVIRVFRVGVPGFSNRAVFVGGLPHISLEDFIASLPLNDESYLNIAKSFNLRHIDLALTMRIANEAGTVRQVKELLRNILQI